MRTEADIRADLSRLAQDADMMEQDLVAKRDALIKEAKEFTKDIATNARRLASAQRKLVLELGQVTLVGGGDGA